MFATVRTNSSPRVVLSILAGLLALPATTGVVFAQGSVVAWVEHFYGQCNVPAPPPGLFYVEVAAGANHTVARRSDGSVVAWGDNGWGQCNVPALPPSMSYVHVASGFFHAVA